MISAKSEVSLRQQLVLVALGKAPADLCLRVGRLLDTATRTWTDDMMALPIRAGRSDSPAQE